MGSITNKTALAQDVAGYPECSWARPCSRGSDLFQVKQLSHQSGLLQL